MAFFTQTLFYLFFTMYFTPFFALLPELEKTPNKRLNLSTYISITYALRIIIAAQTPLITNIIYNFFQLSDKVLSFQIAIIILSILATIFMYVPVLSINEKKYRESIPSEIPLLKAVASTFKNQNLIYYTIEDFSYFMGLTIINSEILYYIYSTFITRRSISWKSFSDMVVISFLFLSIGKFFSKEIR